MGNVMDSLLSGLGHVINKLLGSPLDFLSGKSCDSVCGSTWDLVCYIENFCVAHLLKTVLVSILFYLVVVFFYLSYKLGICKCICWTAYKTIWACFSICFSSVECCCHFLCYDLPRIKRRRRRRKRDIEQLNSISSEEEEGSCSSYHHVQGTSRRSMSRHWRDHKRERLRRSLRARSGRVQDSTNDLHGVRATQRFKVARKGRKHKGVTRSMRRK